MVKRLNQTLVSLLSLSLFLNGCLNQADDQMFNGQPTEIISVTATVAKLDSATYPSESDTILVQDSIILLGDILPDRRVKIQDYWWNIDDSLHASEYFSVRWAFNTPGRHQAVFHAKDRWGDSTSDTVIIWVNALPILGDEFFPATGYQGISPTNTKGLELFWNLSDQDSQASIQTHLKLVQVLSRRQGIYKNLMETVTNDNYALYTQVFSPLQRYEWTLQAIDDYGDTLSFGQVQTFYTKGFANESAIHIEVMRQDSTDLVAPLHPISGIQLILSNHQGQIDTVWANPQEASQFIVEPGIWTLSIKDTLYPEYHIKDTTFTFLPDHVYEWNAVLIDSIEPQILCSLCKSDTLQTKESLILVAVDSGCGYMAEKTKATLDGISIQKTLQGDSIILEPINWNLVPGLHPLNIQIKDCAGNQKNTTYQILGDSNLFSDEVEL